MTTPQQAAGYLRPKGTKRAFGNLPGEIIRMLIFLPSSGYRCRHENTGPGARGQTPFLRMPGTSDTLDSGFRRIHVWPGFRRNSKLSMYEIFGIEPDVKKIQITALIVFLLLPGGLCAGDFTSQYYGLREKEIRKFSVELFSAGEYYRAITEARRYLSLFPEGARSEEMAKLIGDAYLMSHEWAEAASAYDEFFLHFPASPLAGTAIFHKAIALLKQGGTTEAERLFQLILSGADREKKSEAARWEILLLIRQNRFDEAEKLLKDRMLRPEIEKETGLIEELLEEKRGARYKSPETAGVLSALLPGTGQFYNERYRDGVYSFLLNTLFIIAAYKAYESDNYGLGAILTLFEIGWYAGGIYGAVGGAHRHNRKIDEDHFRIGIQRLNLRESEIGRIEGFSVMFTYPF
jgi:TM2 domain-containing membrane protein YozV